MKSQESSKNGITCFEYRKCRVRRGPFEYRLIGNKSLTLLLLYVYYLGITRNDSVIEPEITQSQYVANYSAMSEVVTKLIGIVS